MAEFSKQSREINDPESPGDFDILEMAYDLKPDHYTSIICEGFGFIAIGKDENNKIMLAMPVEDDNFMWKPYEEIIK